MTHYNERVCYRYRPATKQVKTKAPATSDQFWIATPKSVTLCTSQSNIISKGYEERWDGIVGDRAKLPDISSQRFAARDYKIIIHARISHASEAMCSLRRGLCC
jgi:hypothetical protein